MPLSLDPAAEPAAVLPSGRRTLIGSGVVVGVAVAGANALNAVFQFALARILQPAEYSLLAALFTVVLIAAVPTLAFQASAAREIASHLADGRPAEAGLALRATLRAVLAWTLGLLVLTGVVLAPLAAALGLDRSIPFVATGATIALALAIPVLWGALQGGELFFGLSWAQLLYAGSRLAAGLAIGLAGGGAGEVMLGVAAATAATVAASLVPLRRLLAASRGLALKTRRLATLPNAAAAVGLTTLTALTSVDLLVAKLAFDAELAGAYAAASVGSRVLLLAPVAVVTVLFPRVAVLRHEPTERRHLLGGLGVVGLLSVPLIAVLFAAPDPLLDITFGADYERAAPWLGPLAVAMALYGLANLYLFHFLSLGRSRFALVLVALLAVQVAIYGLLHSEPSDLVGVQIGAAAATLAASEVWYLRRVRTSGGPRA